MIGRPADDTTQENRIRNIPGPLLIQKTQKINLKQEKVQNEGQRKFKFFISSFLFPSPSPPSLYYRKRTN